MIKSNYHVDMSQFGKILVEVMSKYHITYSGLYHTTGVNKGYISAVWGGQADYHHSIYVRIVDGLEGWIPERIIRILERNLSVHRLGIRYKIKERKPARRSGGFEIRRQKMSLPI